jgi:S-adenosylmethionine/arginine decarboxylase-like enzyme
MAKKRSSCKVVPYVGHYLVMYCYGGNRETVDSMDVCYPYLTKIVALMHMHQQSEPVVVRTDATRFKGKGGLSCWVALAESGVTLHTFNETGMVIVEVSSCKSFDVNVLMNFTQKTFRTRRMQVKSFTMGEEDKTIQAVA